jgi:uncharacterized protein (TIGR02145 family)
MNLKSISIIFCLASIVLSGCKKEEEETKPILLGEVKFADLPSYVKKGESFHITVSGAYREDGSTLVGYRYRDPLKAVYDTLRRENEEGPVEFDFVISKDTLGTFGLSVHAFATGYYGISKYSFFTVVNSSLGDKGSLSKHPFGSALKTTIADGRDGKTYYITNAGGKSWMAQNLAYSANGTMGRPYEDSEAMNDIFGRYYSHDEALTACPEGWKLPSDADFVALAGSGSVREKIIGVAGALKGDVYFNGEQLWPYQNSSIKLNNISLFTALPLGYLSLHAGISTFYDYGASAIFWTSDAVDAERSLVRYLRVDSNDLFVEGLDNGLRASVRCIKE